MGLKTGFTVCYCFFICSVISLFWLGDGEGILFLVEALIFAPYVLCFCFGLEMGRRRQWQPTPVLLPRKSHGRRSLVDCSPWGRKESDTTERLPFHFSLSYIGEGHGNPLQCYCLESPRDGGAWWAAIYGVSQSQTPLKWLSSSSSRDGKSSR